MVPAGSDPTASAVGCDPNRQDVRGVEGIEPSLEAHRNDGRTVLVKAKVMWCGRSRQLDLTRQHEDQEEFICGHGSDRGGRAGAHANDPDVGKRVGGEVDTSVGLLDPWSDTGPDRVLGRVTNESLTAPGFLRIDRRRTEIEVVVGTGQVLGRVTDLDDVEVGRTLENSMSNARWLGDALSGAQDEGFTLSFVSEPNPTSLTEDQLEMNLVKMGVIGNGAGLSDPDVRGDDRSALTIRHDVAVLHARSTDVPLLEPRGRAESGHESRDGHGCDVAGQVGVGR